ncbi:proteasome complex subunit Rpn13 ubiquitin receptor-domain-containing protein [Pterulicium gracile]|uniref:Proteasome complex subunit Rpn13 ubiquitin receptor-domain-containing protein n=1 Tax=Pterulicium gracile TaxID=1884261 RepID=A0A5C3QLH3_9AGAR|nr:proteasome complex subunit Rpn13 ubiquitin receptor-domain-containing protein [Pterula gracilis]
MDTEILLAFKAGRAFRRGATSSVEPSATKGAIVLSSSNDDGLLHFIWRNRATGENEEDLILFPTDASFEKITQATGGRVYVLKFSSSDQRHFFWLQDADASRDDDFVNNVNGLLQDPEYSLTWDSSNSGASLPATTSNTEGSSNAPAATSASGAEFTPAQLADVQQLIARMTGAASAPESDYSLADILTPANLNPLFSSHPEVIPALFPYLPPDLPVPPSAEALERIISSPQFRSSVASFDQALRTGLLGNLVRGLGLPEEAGTGFEPFLRSVQGQADRENAQGDSADSMRE